MGFLEATKVPGVTVSKSDYVTDAIRDKLTKDGNKEIIDTLNSF